MKETYMPNHIIIGATGTPTMPSHKRNQFEKHRRR